MKVPSHGTDLFGQRYAFDFVRPDDRKGLHLHPAGTLKPGRVGRGQCAHGGASSDILDHPSLPAPHSDGCREAQAVTILAAQVLRKTSKSALNWSLVGATWARPWEAPG
jgi:hypothetical protein